VYDLQELGGEKSDASLGEVLRHLVHHHLLLGQHHHQPATIIFVIIINVPMILTP
jgi:hypothetical protein